MTHEVPAAFAENAYLNTSQYQTLYQHSLKNPDDFWDEQAKQFITWDAPWQTVKTGGFEKLDIAWYVGGKLNACYNCVDRHLEQRKQQIAILWEGDDPKEQRQLTYGELHEQVCRFANVLKKHGVKKGDRVCIYLPMIPEAAIAMLAAARIGAIHSVIFAGFSPDALKTRILDADAKIVVTANEGLRGGKIIPIKKNIDAALTACPNVKTVVVVKRTENITAWEKNRDHWYHDEMQTVEIDCAPEIMDANDPLFILYTSGSTGKPKGVLHVTGGYLVYVSATFHYVFNYQAKDIYWCTADVGWITGHSYVIYGPLANGATTLMYEGTPNYPSFSRFWEVIERHQVTIFYTAPTAIRALRREGEDWIKHANLSSLKLLGTVGEPINPDVWEWYYQVIGKEHCPIVDTWWQTETGGILITPLPGATPLKPGSAAWPFLGIEPGIVDEKGLAIEDTKSGRLIIKQPWPGMMQTIYGDRQRFVDTYFKEIPGAYLTGDGAWRDAEGYYWITGRNDDVIKVSGHRISTAELESAFLTHAAVSEAAVVAIPNEIKGQGIYAFVSTKEGVQPTETLRKELIQHIRQSIGALATPEVIQLTNDLPKTRSGKIMRRILHNIACDEIDSLGDTSTLANPAVLDNIIAEHQKLKG